MNVVWAFVVIAAVCALAIAALLFVRSRAPEGGFFEDGDRAAGVFGVLATGFSVLLGFIVFLAFASYDQSRTGAEQEALILVQQVENALRQSELADFYFARFREEFKPALNAWIATRPLKNAAAPPTPFAMPEYQLEARAEAERLEAAAEGFAAQVRLDIQRASNYVLGVVLFASALFFAGMSTKLTAPKLRVAMLAIGCTVFLLTAIWIATSPISLTV